MKILNNSLVISSESPFLVKVPVQILEQVVTKTNINQITFLGGASTHLQVLSSESRKYLNNGISMSGTFGSLSNESNVVSKAFQIASDLGKPTNSTKDLIEFFKNVPSKYIANYTIWPILESTEKT